MRFYFDRDVASEGTIREIKRSGRSQSLSTTRWTSGLHPLDWIERINQLLPEQNRLPGPEFVAERFGPGSHNPAPTEMLDREFAIHKLREKCLSEQSRRWRDGIMQRMRERLQHPTPAETPQIASPSPGERHG